MTITLTCVLVPNGSNDPFLLVLIPDNKMLELDWRREYAAAISSLFGVPIVLVGRIGKEWRSFGPAPLIPIAARIVPEAVNWQRATFDVSG